MAPTITHLVIGERVFPHLGEFDSADYGAFLLGCTLVDVHCFSDHLRRTTHFANRFRRDGAGAYDRSCASFLEQLDSVLVRPWERLTSEARGFVAGYYCHLATDEDWKRFDVEVMATQGIRWWVDLGVPVGVIMSAFQALSTKLYRDPTAVSRALDGATVPEVFAHVSHDTFRSMWSAIKAPVMEGDAPDLWFGFLEGMGKDGAEMEAERRTYEERWEDAVALIDSFFGGVQPRVEAMVERSLEAMPLLFQRTGMHLGLP